MPLNTRALKQYDLRNEEKQQSSPSHTPQSFELSSSETRGLPTRAYFGCPASRTAAFTAHNHSSSHPTKQCKNGERETSAATQVVLKNMPYANIISEKHVFVSSPRHCLV